MKMNRHLPTVVLSVLVLATLSLHFLDQPKIAYVRSQDLIYHYEGTREAQASFDAKKQQWQANVDTLQTNFRKSQQALQVSLANYNEQEQREEQQKLQQQQQQLAQYTRAIQEKAAEEDEAMMQGALNQINAYTQQYAETQGYDIVLGTTLSGNILYGKEAIDITDEVLIYLNQQYRNEGK